jgi:hypothetical protein
MDKGYDGIIFFNIFNVGYFVVFHSTPIEIIKKEFLTQVK